MRCPKCEHAELEPRADLPGVALCAQCAGLWLPSAAAVRMLHGTQALQPELLDSGAAARARDAATGPCPLGHGMLIRITVYDGEAYSLERCVQCGGMWFDNGEWDRFRANPAEHHVMDWDLTEVLPLAALKEAVERDAMVRELGFVAVALVERLARELKGKAQPEKAFDYLRAKLREP